MNAEVNENDVLDIMYMIADEDDMVTSIDQAADEAANLLELDPNWVHSLVVDEEEEMFPMTSGLTEAVEPMSTEDLLRQFFSEFPPGQFGEKYEHYQRWAKKHADGGPDKVAGRPLYQKIKKELAGQEETTESRSILWHYNEMLETYKKGEITEYEWRYYCTEMLSYLMEEHADVLERVKVEKSKMQTAVSLMMMKARGK